MIKVELTEEAVQTIHTYHKRFEDVWKTATPKGGIPRTRESQEFGDALSAICRQAKEQGVDLE